MKFTDKKFLVVGSGRSGIGAMHLLHQQGAIALLADQSPKASVRGIRDSFLEEDREYGQVIVGEITADNVGDPEYVVLSPAVPTDSPLVSALRERQIPIWSELELGYQCEQGLLLGITGTNGKTTTTTLLGEIMKAAYDAVHVVGNIGYSYAREAMETRPDSVSVAEISSFQLESIDSLHPHVSAILNITPDHLYRHYTMDNYEAAKEMITKNQTADDFCVLNYMDERLRRFGQGACPARVIWFSSEEEPETGYFQAGEEILCRLEKGQDPIRLMNIHDMRLVGRCNVENVMAAIAMAHAAGLSFETILKVVRDFPPVPHRIEFIAEKNGVSYYNDSKATNPDAAIQGIRAMERPTVLIGGGYDKKNTFDEWIEAFDGKVKALVLVGETAQAIADCARAHGFDRIHFCGTFEECMRLCTSLAEPGDSVLLSPACASWGMFDNFEQRGDVFRSYVLGLADGQ